MLVGMSVNAIQLDQGEGPFRKSPLKRRRPSLPHGTNFFMSRIEWRWHWSEANKCAYRAISKL